MLPSQPASSPDAGFFVAISWALQAFVALLSPSHRSRHPVPEHSPCDAKEDGICSFATSSY